MHLYIHVYIQAQLSSSSQSLAAAREEIKKFELQLKTQQQEHEAKVSRMQKQFTATIQDLESKVRKPSLQKEMNGYVHTRDLNLLHVFCYCFQKLDCVDSIT